MPFHEEQHHDECDVSDEGSFDGLWEKPTQVNRGAKLRSIGKGAGMKEAGTFAVMLRQDSFGNLSFGNIKNLSLSQASFGNLSIKNMKSEIPIAIIEYDTNHVASPMSLSKPSIGEKMSKDGNNDAPLL
jgi:hypothetical protein